MKNGKPSEAIVKRSVLKPIRRAAARVTLGPSPWADYSALALEEGQEAVLAVCPVTRTRTGVAAAGVIEAVNNVVCSGAEPLGVMASVLMPTESNEQELRTLMKELDRAAAFLELSVIGGHTEVTRRVKEPLLTVTAIGAVRTEERIGPGELRPGMDLLLTKSVGLQGTAILVHERGEELRKRFPGPFLDQAAAFDVPERLSVLQEARVLAQRAAYLHDLSEGGIFGALWELGQSSEVGLEVELKEIPIRQETVEICEFFDLNPYKLISGGALLAAVEDGPEALRALTEAGVEAALIGRTTEGNDRVIVNGEDRRFLETAQTDELYRVIP